MSETNNFNFIIKQLLIIIKNYDKHYLVVMSSSWNFPSWAESSRAGEFQFSSWNRADNMYIN